VTSRPGGAQANRRDCSAGGRHGGQTAKGLADMQQAVYLVSAAIEASYATLNDEQQA
jgi:hypothetical protein